MPNRSARHSQVSTRSSAFKLAKSGNNLAALNTRPNMVAIAVAASMLPTGVWAGWDKNVEIFADYNSDRSFGGVQALIPLRQTADDMTFLGLRGQYGERSDWEINLGAGHRWFNASREWIFGGYGYFDTREAASDERYNQISIGAEALSVDWDLRANYYKAIGDTDNVVGTTGTAFKGFSVFTNGLLEEALDGGDIEVGHLIPKAPWETRVFAGGYYFDGDKNPDSIDGLRARIETRPRKNIILGLTYSNDDVNEDSLYLEVKYSFGYANESGHRTLEERMIQLPVRDVDIVLTPRPFISDDLSDATVISSNALHIQKDHNAAEDDLSAPLGSYENPFESIADCNAAIEGCLTPAEDSTGEFDYIFVHGVLESGADGNGRTTAATPYDGQFSLLDNQHLIGQGVGIFGVGGSSEAPEVLYTGGGDIITLSEDTDGDGFSNEVAGLNLRDGFGGMDAAIAGHNVNGFDIHDNVIEGARRGIHLTYDTNGGVQDGNGSIRSNEILNSNEYYGYSAHGIYVNSNGSGTFNQTLDLSDNTITGNRGDGINIRSYTYSGGTVNQDITLTGNTVSDNYNTGINLRSNGSYNGTQNQTLTLTGNTVNDNRNGGIDIRNDDTYGYSGTLNQDITLTGNTVNDNGDDGINVRSYIYSGSTQTQTLTLTDNTVNYNYDGNGINIDSDSRYGSTQNQTITLSGNTVNYNYNGSGINIDSDSRYDGTQNQTIMLSGNTVNYNYSGNGGINIDSDIRYGGNQNQTITLTGNTANNNAGYGGGININSDGRYDGTQSQTITLSDNTVSDNSSYDYSSSGGINIISDGSYSSTQNQTIMLTGNTVNDNEYGGIRINNYSEYGGAQNQTIELTSNTVNDNEYGGIRINSYGDYSGSQNQTITLTNNTVNYTYSGNGININNDIEGSSTQNQTLTLSGNTVSGNDRDGVVIENQARNYGYNNYENSQSTQTVTLLDNVINDNYGDGLVIENRASNYSYSGNARATQTVSLQDNEINGNYGDGVVIDNQSENNENDYSTAQATQTVSLQGNEINGNYGDGVVIDNQSSNNSGYSYYGYGGTAVATQTVTLLNNVISGNDGDGIAIDNQSSNNGYSYSGSGGTAEATQTVTLLNDVISGNDGDGIAIDNESYDYYSSDAEATQSVGLTGVTVTDNADYGVYIYNREYGGLANQTVDLSDPGNDFSANSYAYSAYNNGGTQDVIIP